MQLRPELRLRTAIEAMTHVVIPAIDPRESLAIEQAKLVVGMLSTSLDFLPLEFAFNRTELTELVGTATDVADEADSDDLQTATAAATDVLDRAGADPSELLDAIRRLRSALASTVEQVCTDGSDAARRTVADSVLRAAESETLRTRTAYLGHGFEGPAPTLPPLAELLLAAQDQGSGR